MSATILKLPGATAPAPPTRAVGYAPVPRWVCRRVDLSPHARLVLIALLGLVWSEDLACRRNVEEIAEAAGLRPRKVQAALAELIEAGLIRRRRDHRGGAWVTHILFDPRAIEEGPDSPRPKLRGDAPPPARRRAPACAASYIQTSLDFEKTRTSSHVPACEAEAAAREEVPSSFFRPPQEEHPEPPKDEPMPQPRPIRPFCEPPAIPRDQAEREELRRHVDRREEPTERAKPRPHKENPAPSVVGLVEIVREAWPQTPCLEGRVRELAETRGLREAGFAIEYARLKKASGLEYAFKMAHHWYRSGYDLGDIALEVAGARPKAKRDPLETMQNYNPPQSRASDCPPTREEIAACLGDIRSATLPAVRNCYLGILRKWARQGHVEGGLLDEFERPAGGKKPAAGPVGKLPPQSAQVPSPVSQTILRQGEKVQRARLDSNQQPSDSKSAPPPAFPSSKVTIRSAHSPNHPPIRDATAPPPGGCQPDNPTARGADPVSATPVMRIDTIRTSRTPR